jgi:hypothetical protein
MMNRIQLCFQFQLAPLRQGRGILGEILSSTRSILFTSWLNLLLMFIPITFIAQAGGAGDGRAWQINGHVNALYWAPEPPVIGT